MKNIDVWSDFLEVWRTYLTIQLIMKYLLPNFPKYNLG